jgi:hypothetical protein
MNRRELFINTLKIMPLMAIAPLLAKLSQNPTPIKIGDKLKYIGADKRTDYFMDKARHGFLVTSVRGLEFDIEQLPDPHNEDDISRRYPAHFSAEYTSLESMQHEFNTDWIRI